MQQARIRVVALGLIQQGDRLLVAAGYDPVKQRRFYRALGGGVEFGESSLEALKREFWEEIQAELINIRYLGCLESFFVYNGQPGHEVIQLYRCDFADPRLYHAERLLVKESTGETAEATWHAIAHFRSGDSWLVPEAVLPFLEPDSIVSG